MKLYEVYTPELGIHVRYRMLTPDELDLFTIEYQQLNNDEFMRAVLETVIYNLKTDVTEILRKLSKTKGKEVLTSLFHGCVMLNPGMDVRTWLKLTAQPNGSSQEQKPRGRVATKSGKVSRSKFLGLESYLKSKIIGQDPAIEEIVQALKRSQVGLNDEDRPLGAFLFSGASGIGKTKLAKELHSYLFGDEFNIVRIDCGEYQHKHENQKLLGSPAGYIGSDEGGQLSEPMAKNPHTVLLLDEVEKAHPDLWHTFLRVFDEGIMTDAKGNKIDFRDCIIIMTTNLGNRQVVEELTNKRMGFNSSLTALHSTRLHLNRDRVLNITMEAIRKHFSPEFINRLDKVITFNQLTDDDFEKIADMEFQAIEAKLAKRGCSLVWDKEAVTAMVRDGVSTVQGARGLAQLRRDRIENRLADLILSGKYPKGSTFNVSWNSDYRITAKRPKQTMALTQGSA